MKKLFTSLAFATTLALAGSAMAKEVTSTLKVSGWHCAGCSAKTESALKSIKGVKSVKAEHEKGTAMVTYDDASVTAAQLEKAVADSGFKVAK